MNNEPFVIERTYEAPVDIVWEAITNKEEMKKWYFDIAAFRPEVGFEFQFTGGTEDRQYVHLCTITDVVPGRKIRYSWAYKGYDGKSFVTFELFAEGNRTRLKLTHEGLDTFPPLPDFAKENFVLGWTSLIGTQLKNFAEKGYPAA